MNKKSYVLDFILYFDLKKLTLVGIVIVAIIATLFVLFFGIIWYWSFFLPTLGIIWILVTYSIIHKNNPKKAKIVFLVGLAATAVGLGLSGTLLIKYINASDCERMQMKGLMVGCFEFQPTGILTITGYDMREFTLDEPLRLHDGNVINESARNEIVDNKKSRGEMGAIYIKNIGTGPVEIKQVKVAQIGVNYLFNFSVYVTQTSGSIELESSEISAGEEATIIVEFTDEMPVGKDVAISVVTEKGGYAFNTVIGKNER